MNKDLSTLDTRGAYTSVYAQYKKHRYLLQKYKQELRLTPGDIDLQASIAKQKEEIQSIEEGFNIVVRMWKVEHEIPSFMHNVMSKIKTFFIGRGSNESL